MGREIRYLPTQEQRVETGPVQFGDDWPGVFIRGDHAGYYSFQINELIDALERDDYETAKTVAVFVKWTADLLSSSIVGPAREMFDKDNMSS